ncbi:MAG: HAD-IA family hydrolase [Gammaproteobacteria bacterium]
MPISTAPTTISATELIERYSVLLLDAYGVLVHGGGALPGAATFVERLKRSGKPYFILTNDAAKLPATAAARYRSFGLDIEPERIISAGILLKDYFAAQGLAGKRCQVLGPADSVRYVEMAGGEAVTPGEDFDVLVVADESGFPFLETVDTVLSSLFARIDRHLPPELILVNPDLIFPTAAAGFGLAAGSIALILEAALHLRYPDRNELRFTRLGKPHPWAFEAALQRVGSRDMVMIGDQLETDIRGANAFGIDSALVTGGVSGAALTLSPGGPRPRYVVESLLA